jgi:WD40 repeat protein
MRQFHSQAVYAVDFSPNGQQFAAGGLDTSVKLFDLEKVLKCRHTEHLEESNAQHYQELKDKSWWLTGLAFTSDGKRLATVSDGMVTFWDPVTLEQIGTFRVNEQIRRIAFLPDAMFTASTEGYVRLWKATPESECSTIDFALF